MEPENNTLRGTMQNDIRGQRRERGKGTRVEGGHLLRVLAVIVGVLLGAVALASPSRAQTSPSLSFVTPREEPHMVALEEVEGQDSALQGQLDALLLNDSEYEGPLIVEFVPEGTEQAIPLGPAPDFPEDKLGFFTTASDEPYARPFSTVQLPLRFGVGSAPEEPVDGVVIARPGEGAKIRLATLRVQVTPPVAGSRWSEAKFVPSTVTIDATRWTPTPLRRILGMAAFDREVPIWVRGVGPGEPIAAGHKIATTRLSSGTGGFSKVEFLFEEKLPDKVEGEVKGTLRADDIQRAGSYEGSLAVDPTVETAPTATVKLRAQDLWVWPLLAIFAGALLARWLGNWRDQGRLKNLLRAELGLAFRRYKTDRATFADDCPYSLAHIFGDSAELNLECPPPQQSPPKARVTYCDRIKGGKTREDLQDAIAEVRDIQQVVALWPDICRAAKELRSALDGLPQEGGQIRAATEEMLRKDPPLDSKATKERLELYRRQTRAVGLWMQGWGLYEAACRLYDDLEGRNLPDPDERERQDSNPRAVLDAYLKPATSLEELAESGAVALLRESYRVLLTLAFAHPARRKVGAAVADGTDVPPTPFQPLITEAFRRYASPGEIVAMVRSRDWLDFLATFLLTALAFLVTIYVGKDFGSGWQYLTAFLAGATGQVAVNWALLPWYRSYRVASAPSTPGA